MQPGHLRSLSLALLLAAGPALAQTAGPAGGFGALPAAGKAQDIKPQDVISWEGFQAEELGSDRVKVSLRMTAKGDWKVYAQNLKLAGPAGFELTQITPPPSKKFLDPISNEEVDIYEGGEFVLTFTGAPRWTSPTFPVSATYVGCTNVICLFPYTQNLDVTFIATPASATLASAAATSAAPTIAPEPPTSSGGDFESQLAKKFSLSTSLGTLLLIVFVGGLLSNLTPCVYPMIPITLRLLGRQGSSPYLAATFYALGIVVTYTALGMVAAMSGGLFGSLMASKGFNVAFAVIMVVLGFTMLGFGDFSKLMVLGNKLGSGPASLKNTFLMGTGAGLVAAPCTGPILAALLAYTTKNNSSLGESCTLLFSYSLGFGLPYVALGGAAAKVSRAKVPPQIQLGVKLLFASVMFGLGLFYLRIPLYQSFEKLKPVWPTVAGYGLVIGGLLAAVWVIVPRLQNHKISMILPTAILGIGIFAGSQVLTGSGQAGTGHDSVTWHKTEAEGFALAKAQGKPILIDMWAEWCEACKKMDRTTFADPKMLAVLGPDWILVKLDLTEDNDANTAIQQKYGIQGLPTFVLLPPSGDFTAKKMITAYIATDDLLQEMKAFTKRAE